MAAVVVLPRRTHGRARSRAAERARSGGRSSCSRPAATRTASRSCTGAPSLRSPATSTRPRRARSSASGWSRSSPRPPAYPGPARRSASCSRDPDLAWQSYAMALLAGGAGGARSSARPRRAFRSPRRRRIGDSRAPATQRARRGRSGRRRSRCGRAAPPTGPSSAAGGPSSSSSSERIEPLTDEPSIQSRRPGATPTRTSPETDCTFACSPPRSAAISWSPETVATEMSSNASPSSTSPETRLTDERARARAAPERRRRRS